MIHLHKYPPDQALLVASVEGDPRRGVVWLYACGLCDVTRLTGTDVHKHLREVHGVMHYDADQAKIDARRDLRLAEKGGKG